MSYITTVFPSPINSAFKPAFIQAGDFWNKVLVRGSGGFTFSSNTNAERFCGVDFTYRAGDRVNGLDIFAVVEPIDGPGSILGAAGPCAFLGDFPILGLMRFDSADAQGLLNQGNFAEVIIHEMGHVIGLGTIWGNLVTNPCPTNTNRPCTTNPLYVGRNGQDGFKDLGGSGPVPVADTGGPGTLNGHWREDFFVNELMTGFLNSGTRNPLSVMTVKSLMDIGYSVDLTSSESYNIPSQFQRPLDTDDLEMVGDMLFFDAKDIKELQAEQRIEIPSASYDDSVLAGLFVFMLIGFFGLAFLMKVSQNKQQRQIQALMTSSAQPQYTTLPTRK